MRHVFSELVLYPINGIRSFLIGVSIARHGDLAGQIGLIRYYIQLQKDGGRLGNLYQNAGFDNFAHTGDIYCLFYRLTMKIG